MPKYHMTWVASTRRWKKMHRGRMHVVSCKQLGTPETKEGSWRAANAWWERQLAAPAGDDRVARAAKISELVRGFSGLDDDARKEAVDALLGAGTYGRLAEQADAVVAALDAPAPGQTVREQADAWVEVLHSACRAGQLSEGRYDAYRRKITPLVDYLGAGEPVGVIDEGRLEGFHAHLAGMVDAGRYSPVTAHEVMMTARQFIRRLAELRLIPLPGNIASRRLRFNHSAARKVDVFTAEEVREIIGRARGRMRLHLLLMLNCGMYQNDVAELRRDEISMEAGTITRSRSKTRERNGPIVTYKLWPETFGLLREYRADGELALTTERGNPLVRYWLEGGRMRRYDAVQSAWARMGKARLGLKHLRKTSATMLAAHPAFKFYSNHFLADSPKGIAERHYVVPSNAEFFEALDWLRLQYFPDAEAEALLDEQ